MKKLTNLFLNISRAIEKDPKHDIFFKGRPPYINNSNIILYISHYSIV